MNRNRFFLEIFAISLICVTFSDAEINRSDPLFKNYVIGNSAEIVMTWSGTPDNDSCDVMTYDFNGTNISPAGHNVYDGFPAHRYLKMHDIATGDFNGDGKDDLVMAHVYGDSSIRVLIPVMEGPYLMGPNHWEAVVGELYLGHIPYDYLDYANVHVISGNFDDDAKREFAVAFWNSDNKNITIQVYDADVLSSPNMVASIDADYLDPDLEDAARFDLTAGDFNGDGIDEIFLAAGYIISGTEFGVFAKVFKCDLENNVIDESVRRNEIFLYDNYWMEGTSKANGEGKWVERITVATGDLNNDKRDELVLAFQERAGWWDYIWPTGYSYKTWTNYYLQPLSVSADLSSINFNPENRIHYNSWDSGNNTGWITHNSGQAWPYYVLISGPAMSVAAGDLNLDGREEVLWLVEGRLHAYTLKSSLEVDTEVIYDDVG